MSGSKINSGIEGSPKNPRHENSPPRRVKRRRNFTSVETERFLTQAATTVPVPRYLIVKQKEGDFANVSPFLIQKSITACAGSAVKDIKKIGSGLMIETLNDEQGRKLLSMEKFGDVEVEVSPHATLNTTKGVVVCRDLLNCTEEEIATELASQGVIACRRLTVRRDGQTLPSASHVLTFNRTALPEKIRAGIHRLSVRAFIPQPMQCFQCLRFGHTASRCARVKTCFCGKSAHGDDPCAEPMKCVNCGGQHSSRSRNCPTYKTEVAIQEIKTLRKISYPEAKKLVCTDTQGRVSFAQAVKSTAPAASVAKELLPAVTSFIDRYMKEVYRQTSVTNEEKAKTQELKLTAGNDPLPKQRGTETTYVAAIAATSSGGEMASGYRRPPPPPPKYNREDFIKNRPGTRSVPNTQDASSGSELSSIAGASDLTDLGDLAEFSEYKKKKKGWPKGKPRK